MKIDSALFLDEVNVEINGRIKLPHGTTVIISAEDILGSQYLCLELEERHVAPEGSIAYTQHEVYIIGLINQMIYNPKENN